MKCFVKLHSQVVAGKVKRGKSGLRFVMLRTGDRKGSAQTKTLLLLARARKAGPAGSSCTKGREKISLNWAVGELLFRVPKRLTQIVPNQPLWICCHLPTSRYRMRGQWIRRDPRAGLDYEISPVLLLSHYCGGKTAGGWTKTAALNWRTDGSRYSLKTLLWDCNPLKEGKLGKLQKFSLTQTEEERAKNL